MLQRCAPRMAERLLTILPPIVVDEPPTSPRPQSAAAAPFIAWFAPPLQLLKSG